VRKVVLYTLMSLDGAVDDPAQYFSPDERPGQPPEFDAVMDENEERITSTQDTVLLGRGMFEEWVGYWPTVENQPFADFINRVKKYVVTSSPLTREWTNAEAVEGPASGLVRDLKARSGGDIGVHGSIQLAQSLLEAGLVDELQLVIGPAYGFPGRRLFPNPDTPARLELLSAARTPTGSLLLAYRIPTDASAADLEGTAT
jgi:dihydrofolate reductase